MKSKGEVAALAETINNMTGTLAIFADQVTTVAREVGVEGRLGGQAHVPGASGTWKDLTGNVNLLAANLTNQVRAIAEVATAVTKGDLTRSIQVDARGEVAELKDNINTMIENLAPDHGAEHRAGLAENQSRPLHRHAAGPARSGDRSGGMLLSELVPLVSAHQGLIYQIDSGEQPHLRLLAKYADDPRTAIRAALELGDSFIGQCARRPPPDLRAATLPEDAARIDSVLVEAGRAASWCSRSSSRTRSRRSSRWPR